MTQTRPVATSSPAIAPANSESGAVPAPPLSQGPDDRSGTTPAQVVLRNTSREQVRHHARRPASPPEHAPWPAWLPVGVRTAIEDAGITRPFRHQAEVADLAWHGESVVVATGTASGKSLAYLMPVMAALSAAGEPGAPGPSAIYLAPTKALAADQRRAVAELGIAGVRPALYDGDTSKEDRAWARRHANYLLTNPDMLHHGILPRHDRWSRVLRGLRFVVVDECHHYRGVFGSHVAHVVRRLLRLARHHGADPVVILASATVAEPATTARRLTGLTVHPVETDTSGRGVSDVVFLEPALASSPDSPAVRRSLLAETAALAASLVRERTRGLAFVSSRRGVEVVAGWAQQRLSEECPERSGRVAAYRGGYLPHERRELERAIQSGELDVLAATSALELGVDISGLDAVIVAGWPGTRASFWQRAGRAGRAGKEAVVALVAGEDPLDQYLLAHPEAVLGQPTEATVCDPTNPYVMAPQLCAAAAELPLTEAEVRDLAASDVVAGLEHQGYLRKRSKGWYWARRERASDLADIRSGRDSPVRLVEATTGALLGTVDHAASHLSAHPGAVYQHQGQTYLVLSLDLDDSVAFLEPASPDYFTVAGSVSSVDIVQTEHSTQWPFAQVSLGVVDVTHQVTSYLRRSLQDGRVLSEHALNLPERTLRTQGTWWTLDDAHLSSTGLGDHALPGAAHAAEHAGIGLLPLFATCDRWDVGGVSTARHPDTERLTVVVHDGHPGGAGFARRGFESAPAWWRATREAIASCSCQSGCPSCVHSPKCGNGNEPLDKDGAVRLLDLLLRDSD